MGSSEMLVSALQEWAEVFMRRSMRDLVLYSRQSGLALSHIGAMFHLRRKGVCGVSEIGDDLGTTSAAASQMLDRLAKQGLVRRTEDPEDRRAKRVSLTDEGHHLLREITHAHRGWLDEIADTLSPSEREQIADSLRLLVETSRRLERGRYPEIGSCR